MKRNKYLKKFLYKAFAPFHRNSIINQDDYLQPLVEAARSHCYVENIGNKADSLHRRIEQINEEQICDAYVRVLRPRIKSMHCGSVMLACDFTEEDFYGYTNDLWLHPWTGEAGVQATYAFAVLSLVGKYKIPLIAVPVHRGMSKEEIFSLLLTVAQELFKHIRCILLDAGFYSGEVTETLENRGLKYLTRAPQHENVQRYIAQTQTWDTYRHTIVWTGNKTTHRTKTNIIIVKQVRLKNRYVDCSYATNMQLHDGMSYVHLYRKRWQIETNFRMEDQVRIKSKSTRITIRYFYFMISLLLHALWQLCWQGKMSFDAFKVHLANQLSLACYGIEYIRPVL